MVDNGLKLKTTTSFEGFWRRADEWGNGMFYNAQEGTQHKREAAISRLVGYTQDSSYTRTRDKRTTHSAHKTRVIDSRFCIHDVPENISQGRDFVSEQLLCTPESIFHQLYVKCSV